MSTVIQPADEMTDNTHKEQEISQLYNAVKHSVRRYLYELDGSSPNEMYDMVLRQVERPLLEAVLDYTHGNQSKAAEYLGLNRGTLRKKIRDYNLG